MFASEVKVSLFIFSFSDAILTLLIIFFKLKILDLNNVCCFCLILLFVLTCLPNNGWSRQSRATFFTLLSHLFWRRLFCSYIVFENYLKNWNTIGCSFGGHLCQKFGWAGSELYVRTHITAPPCYSFIIVLWQMNFSSPALFPGSRNFPKIM